jgi:hypothetical protein
MIAAVCDHAVRRRQATRFSIAGFIVSATLSHS